MNPARNTVALPQIGPIPPERPQPVFGSALQAPVQAPPSMLDYAPRQAAPAPNPFETLLGGISQGWQAGAQGQRQGLGAGNAPGGGDNPFQIAMRIAGAALAPPEVTRAVNAIRHERQERREAQAERAKQNQTVAHIYRNFPEAVPLLEAGYGANDSLKWALDQRKQKQASEASQKFISALPPIYGTGQDQGQPSQQPGGNSLLFPRSMTDNVPPQPAQPVQTGSGGSPNLDKLMRQRAIYVDALANAPDDQARAVVKGKIGQVDQMISQLPDARPMTAQERAQWGIPETDTRPYALTDSGPKLIGGSGVTVNNNLSPEGGMFAGLPKDIRGELLTRRGAAQDAADLIGVTNQGLQLLDHGAITGAGSGVKIAAVKWAQSLGVPIDGDIASVVNNTEAYRSIMAKAVAKQIKNFGSRTGLSDADREYAERLAGGDTTLNEPAIRRILAAGMQSARTRISNYNTMRDNVLKGDLSAILNVQEPPEYIPPPAAAPRARNPQTGQTLEWDGSQWRPME